MIKILEAKTNKVIWYKNNNEVYSFDDIHVHYIINNPELFNLTQNKIQDIYNQYNEPIGTEGKARGELLQLVIRKGWIRVRCRNNKWFIEVDNFQLRRSNIKECIQYLLLESEDMQVTDYISIWGKDNNVYEGIVKNIFHIFEGKK